MATVKNNDKNTQKEFFRSLSEDGLKEMAKYIGLQVTDKLDKEELISLLENNGRKEITYSPVVKLPDGNKIECPVGHAVIQIARKTSQEFGAKTSEVYFCAVQGQALVLKRGVPHLVHEKYLGVIGDAIESVYTGVTKGGSVGDPGAHVEFVESTHHADEYQIIAHNPDYLAAEAAERELQENAAKLKKTREQKDLIQTAMLDRLTA